MNTEIQPGTIIVYLLRSDQRPRDPTYEWRGRVEHAYGSDAVMVDVLNEGYEGEQEPVFIDQIRRIEPCA